MNREKEPSEKLAFELIGMVSKAIESGHPELQVVKEEDDTDSEQALICGNEYYQLESEMAELIDGYVGELRFLTDMNLI